MSALIFGLFGLIVGSFLNVVIVRRGVRTLLGRSSCMHCGRTLSGLDLIPLISYIALRGRCRYCGSGISLQYPLVEAMTAALFAALGASPLPFLLQLLALPIAALFVCIAIYDARHTIIPNEWVYPLAVLSLLFSVLQGGAIAANVLTGIGAAAPFSLLWLISRGRWMGLGDSKLALAIGFLLGPLGAYVAITAAFVLGALFFVPFVFLAKVDKRAGGAPSSYTMQSEVPLGPFLIFACIIVWFLQIYGVAAAFLLV